MIIYISFNGQQRCCHCYCYSYCYYCIHTLSFLNHVSCRLAGGSYYYRLDGRDANRINGAVNWKTQWWWLLAYVILHVLLTLTVCDVMR